MNPEQSELSAQALLNTVPDDAFVTDLIKHWWQQPAPATSVTQQPSALPSSELPSALNVQGGPPDSVSMTEGHFQSGQSLAPFTAGHPQASSIDTLTDKLLGDTGQGPPAGAKTHSTPILYQGLSNPSPIVPGPAPERTNCSVQGDTATAAAAAADQHADLAEPPLELSASSLLSQRQSPAMTSSSLSALQSPGQTPSALPADQTENIYLRPASSSLGHEHDSGQSSPSSDHISAGSQELSVSCAQVSSASQRPSSSGHVSHTSQHPSSLLPRTRHRLPATLLQLQMPASTLLLPQGQHKKLPTALLLLYTMRKLRVWSILLLPATHHLSDINPLPSPQQGGSTTGNPALATGALTHTMPGMQQEMKMKQV